VNCIYIDPPYNTSNEGWCQQLFDNNPVNNSERVSDALRKLAQL
jgi:16S rRNA G966 N2-methylase RsmD